MPTINDFYGSTLHNTPTYNSWLAMKQRCFYSDHVEYHRYGAVGITVCDQWLTFEGFFKDMGYRPDGMTLDREDSKGNYEPSNCRWASKETQANNCSTNVRLEHEGEIKTLAQWGRDGSKVSQYAMSKRIRRGWTAEQAISLPSGTQVKSRETEKSLATRFQPKIIEHDGKSQSIKDWSKELGFTTPSSLSKRIASGMPLDQALTPPNTRYQTVLGKKLKKLTF